MGERGFCENGSSSRRRRHQSPEALLGHVSRQGHLRSRQVGESEAIWDTGNSGQTLIDSSCLDKLEMSLVNVEVLGEVQLHGKYQATHPYQEEAV